TRHLGRNKSAFSAHSRKALCKCQSLCFFGQLSGSSEPSKCQIFAISSYIEDGVSEYTFVCVCTNLQYHPDRLGGDCSSEAESGVKKFLEVDAAWRVLSDQTTRTQYDLQRRAWTLKQDWPIDSTVYVDDMTWDDDQGLYTHSCRCGGVFSVTEEELEEEPQRKQQDEGEKETKEGRHKGAIVCCDTCSLSVYVTWSTNEKAQKCQ
uniref:DnaJ heat shock protein family (Hsp40) member C24 n=1 Tax=Haplochromis burtoni TaxID=8153 RepID=A0A3Q2V0S0_HAPBU